MKKNIPCILISGLFGFFIAWTIIGPILFDDSVIQDDFRNSMFMLWELWDPDLFANDFIKSIYTGNLEKLPLLYLIYKIAPVFTNNLIFYSKLLALILATASTIMSFLFFNRITKNLILSLFASMAFAVSFWCTDHLSASHSRSFIWLNIFLFLFLKESRRNLLSGLFCFLQLFYAPVSFLICLVMEFFYWLFDYCIPSIKDTATKSSIFKNTSFKSLALNTFSALFTQCWAFKRFSFYGQGTQLSVDEIRHTPEFNPGGRHPIFGSSFFDGSWWTNEHWGLGIGYMKISEIILVAVGIVLLYLFIEKLSIKKIPFKHPVVILFYSALSLYIAAQALFPVLYMPSRYLGIPLLICSIFLIYTFFDYAYVKFVPSKVKNVLLYAVLCFALSAIFCSYFTRGFHARFVNINKEVQAIIKKSPENSLFAGHPLLPDLNMVLAVCKRKVFIDYEHSMSYMKEKLVEIRRRNYIALQMTFSETEEEFFDLAHQEGITHFMIHGYFYEPLYLSNPIYMEPYNQFLRELILRRKHFFLQDVLEKNHTQYMIFEVNKNRGSKC